jgi:molybdenum cofactor cytidylyltransferase
MVYHGIVGIYLAAGKSSRMGTNKLHLPVGGDYLGSIAFRAALDSRLDVTIAVTRQGDLLPWLAPFSKRNGWRQLECREAEEGQSASLKAGVRLAEALGAQGVVVLLADQPFVTMEMINQLIKESVHSQNIPYFSFTQKGISKPPVLFTRSMFPALLELEGDQGARSLIRKGVGKKIVLEEDIYFLDVDTEEDYRTISKILGMG